MIAGARKALADDNHRTFLPPEAVADAVAIRLASDDAGVIELIEHGRDVQRIEFPRYP
jgi:hypothetical protein